MYQQQQINMNPKCPKCPKMSNFIFEAMDERGREDNLNVSSQTF
jgi:hypothetical protein